MANPKSFKFEEALTELEAITNWFESADVNLDAGIEKFERGMELSAQLKAHLATVENRVEKIKARYAVETDTANEVFSPDEPPVDLFS